MKYRKKTKKKRLKKQRKTYKKIYKRGGSRLLPWVGVPKLYQPTGFGWISNKYY